MHHANKCIIFAAFNYCYKIDQSQYDDSIMAYLFKIPWVGSLNWEGLPLLHMVVAGITHMVAATWQASSGWLVPDVLLIGLVVD